MRVIPHEEAGKEKQYSNIQLQSLSTQIYAPPAWSKRSLARIRLPQTNIQRISSEASPWSPNIEKVARIIPLTAKTTPPSRSPPHRRCHILRRTHQPNQLVRSCIQRCGNLRRSLVAVHRDRNYHCISYWTKDPWGSWLHYPFRDRRWLYRHQISVFRHSIPNVPGAYGTPGYERHNQKAPAGSWGSVVCFDPNHTRHQQDNLSAKIGSIFWKIPRLLEPKKHSSWNRSIFLDAQESEKSSPELAALRAISIHLRSKQEHTKNYKCPGRAVLAYQRCITDTSRIIEKAERESYSYYFTGFNHRAEEKSILKQAAFLYLMPRWSIYNT